MNKKWKRTLGVVMATVSLGSAFALAGCNGAYTGDKLDAPALEASVSSNGGFAVQKGDFVYFINGMEDYTEPNVYGDVVKGSLMRIKKADLDEGKYEKVKTVVPMLFAAQNFDAGIYIYDDYVYYATPTTDKNMDGEVESSWIDFKRAKLDGTETMKDYYFRLSSNSSKYRFVKEGDVVYCLYEEGGYLKSYDTKEKVSRVLANADSYYYDTSDPTNPTVYYTMPVEIDVDSDNSTTAAYNQLYSVNAAARVEENSVGEKDGVASYKVKGGKEYKFDAKYLKEQSDEAVKGGGEATFDAKDYTTYPYVNLGKAVLDGIGSNALKQTQFNGNKADALTPDGYTYTVKDYANGGVYFTRAEVAKTSSDAESTKLYYLADTATTAATWNIVKGNDELDVVAPDSAVVESAIKTVKSGAHEYYYLSEGALYKALVGENGATTEIKMASNLSGATLWKLDGNYLYYYQSPENGNGNSLSRINVTGAQKDYNTLLDQVEYQPITLAGVQFNSSWYKPEIFGNKVLFSNEQSFGSVTYNYIYAANLPATQAEIKAINEKYEAVQEAIDEYADNTDLQNLMTYYFRTGKTDAYTDAVKSLYEKTEQTYFNEFKEKFSATTEKLELESYFFDLVGEMKEADETAIDEAWVKSLRSEEETDEESGLPGWAIGLIVAGSVIVVLAAALIPTLIMISKKKAKAKAAEETVNAYKRKKIDTTDDKSIDVYADENAETPTEEATEEAEGPAEDKCCHCKACAAAEEDPAEEKDE